MDIAKSIDKKLVKAALSSSVDGQVWDLTRPLQGDCTIEILTWEDAKGKDVRLLLQGIYCLHHTRRCARLLARKRDTPSADFSKQWQSMLTFVSCADILAQQFPRLG